MTPSELGRTTPWSGESWQYGHDLIPDAWEHLIRTVNSDREGHGPAFWARVFCLLREVSKVDWSALQLELDACAGRRQSRMHAAYRHRQLARRRRARA